MIVYNLDDNYKKKGFKIEFSRDDGTDICGEWYSINRWSFVAWQDYRLYDGNIYKNNNKNYKIRIVCGYSRRELHTEKCKSLKEAKSKISEFIKSNYKMLGYYNLYSASNVKSHVFKRIDGEMTWFASSLEFGRGFQDKQAFGYGTIYTAFKYHWSKRVDGLGFWEERITGGGYSGTGLDSKETELEIIKALYLS
jgi:hypothetical protein